MFKTAYNYLDKKEKFMLRDKILKECDFSYPSFYNYLSGRTELPKLVYDKIRDIIIRDYPKKMLKIFDNKN
jgi:hypothetical protein